MSETLIIALAGLVAKIGLEATAIWLEGMNKPNATIDDAIAACRAAEKKRLSDFIAEDAANRT